VSQSPFFFKSQLRNRRPTSFSPLPSPIYSKISLSLSPPPFFEEIGVRLRVAPFGFLFFCCGSGRPSPLLFRRYLDDGPSGFSPFEGPLKKFDLYSSLLRENAFLMRAFLALADGHVPLPFPRARRDESLYFYRALFLGFSFLRAGPDSPLFRKKTSLFRSSARLRSPGRPLSFFFLSNGWVVTSKNDQSIVTDTPQAAPLFSLPSNGKCFFIYPGRKVRACPLFFSTH